MTVSLPSRGLRGYAGGVLAGGVSAGIFTYSLTLKSVAFVMLSILAASPLFIVGLGAGVEAGILAVVTAFALLVATKTVNFAAYYAVVFGFPASALTFLALRRRDGPDGKTVWFPEGDLLTAMTLYPCVAFIAAEAAALSYKNGLLGMALDVMKTYADQLKTHPVDPTHNDPRVLEQFIALLNVLAHMLPALIGCGWILVMLLSMFVSQITLRQQGWNLRPDFEIAKIFVSKWLAIAALAGVLAGYYAPAPFNYIGGNLCAMLLVPYFFQGIAVVHAKAASSLFRLWILWGYYVFLLFPFKWTTAAAFFLTILLGIVDVWANFRPRFAARQLSMQLKIRG